MQLSVYRLREDQAQRVAVPKGEALPVHLDPKEWELMTTRSKIPAFVVNDIEVHGFSYFRLPWSVVAQ